jgi:hypothetical protein
MGHSDHDQRARFLLGQCLVLSAAQCLLPISASTIIELTFIFICPSHRNMMRSLRSTWKKYIKRFVWCDLLGVSDELDSPFTMSLFKVQPSSGVLGGAMERYQISSGQYCLYHLLKNRRSVQDPAPKSIGPVLLASDAICRLHRCCNMRRSISDKKK